jgi:ATP-dependent exoDNAse (exonuclease V) alpha subunit
MVKFADRPDPVKVTQREAKIKKMPPGGRSVRPIVRRYQIPLTVSRAITIHKSQGQTLQVVKVRLPASLHSFSTLLSSPFDVMIEVS